MSIYFAQRMILKECCGWSVSFSLSDLPSHAVDTFLLVVQHDMSMIDCKDVHNLLPFKALPTQHYLFSSGGMPRPVL
jgi:hypothetical protein